MTQPAVVVEAQARQELLRARVATVDDHPPLLTAAGLDLAYDTACDLVLRLAPRYRQPETTRQADSASRTALRRFVAECHPGPGG
jgi:deoxyinosine 3'endonuclease (endonuclease V)